MLSQQRHDDGLIPDTKPSEWRFGFVDLPSSMQKCRAGIYLSTRLSDMSDVIELVPSNTSLRGRKIKMLMRETNTNPQRRFS